MVNDRQISLKNIIFSGVINCWISVTKYLRYQYGVTQMYSNRRFTYVTSTNNIWFRQNFTSTMHCLLAIKLPNFLLNLPKQTTATTAFVRSPKTLQFQVWRHPKRAKTEVFWGDLAKAAVTIVCLGRFSLNLALWLPVNGALLR